MVIGDITVYTKFSLRFDIYTYGGYRPKIDNIFSCVGFIVPPISYRLVIFVYT